MISRKDVIYKSFAITFAVMFLGLLIGVLIYNYQTYSVDKEINDLKVRVQELSLLSDYVSMDIKNESSQYCDFYNYKLVDFARYVNEYGVLISRYYNNQKDIERIKYIQKDFVVANLKLFVGLSRYNEYCPQKKNYIMYLYPYNCNNCDGVALEVRRLVKDYKGLYSFSIPAEIDLASVEMIIDRYDINEYPAVVVNGTTLQGPECYNDIEKYLNK